MSESEQAKRRTAIHLLRSGKSVSETAEVVERSPSWVYKWRNRFRANGWSGLGDQSRARKEQGTRLPERVRQEIRIVRSELEAEAQIPGKLNYIGAQAMRARLQAQQLKPLPSITSIERELRAAGMTRPRRADGEKVTHYPHLHPAQPLGLVQIDIVPHYLPGGRCVSCFHAIDVVSHYPIGWQSLTKRSGDAAQFLVRAWQALGIPDFTQLDNEGCFSGGSTHPAVLGKVVRLALLVGTQLVFSPFYHPESNGTVERFHQEYSRHVWKKLDLPDFSAVVQSSPGFFEHYRHSGHHSALQGHCPADLHPKRAPHQLPNGFRLPAKLPITVGQVHFMRQVTAARQVSILNLTWEVPKAEPDQGVWATLHISSHSAKLRIYDAPPDAQRRTCLAEHPFPLKEPVQPLAPTFQRFAQVPRPSGWRSVISLAVRWLSMM